MPTSTIWPLDEHTKGKHLVLDRYLKAWLPILSRYHGRLLIVDGFAGPGEYAGGEKGSPIIALDAVLEHRDKVVAEQEVVFHFIEKDAKRAAHLRDLINEKYPALPKNIIVHVINNAFDTQLRSTLDAIAEQNKRLAPCFLMIDPFGVSNLPMSLIQKFLENDRAEVYVSFMYEFVNRFKATKEFERHLDELYGCPEWRAAIEIDDATERREMLQNLYRSQLKLGRNMQVVNFELFNGNRHVYTIFFSSKSALGVDRMKEAVWKIAPDGDFRYQGQQGQGGLELSAADFEPLQQQIVDKFSGVWTTAEEIQCFVASDQSIYYSAQVKKKGLRPLEEQGRIVIHEDVESRRRFTYPNHVKFMITG